MIKTTFNQYKHINKHTPQTPPKKTPQEEANKKGRRNIETHSTYREKERPQYTNQ